MKPEDRCEACNRKAETHRKGCSVVDCPERRSWGTEPEDIEQSIIWHNGKTEPTDKS